jgi:hypothetical protein
MSLHSLDMPDDHRELAAWLERRLVGPDLGELAAELAAAAPAEGGPAPAADDLLGEWREVVLAGGLKLAPPELLQRLLAHPQRLLDLQEQVLTRGGRYWDRVAAWAEAPDLLERSRARLAAALPEDARPQPAPAVLPLKQAAPRRRWVWAAAGAVAAAAAVLLAVLAYQHFNPPTLSPPTKIAWGWNKPGVLAADVPRDAYLHRLADAAGEWFDQRPEDAAGTAKRLNEFRGGCSALLLAEHRPLTEDDRRWLKDKCREWAAKLDAALAEVEAGQVQKGRDDADATARQLVEALHKRAAERAAA